MTNGWLTLVKQQQEQLNTRSKRYQESPSPWIPASTATNRSTVVATSASARTTSLLDDDEHDPDNPIGDESMPAPLYRESFFSAIDESLKLIESSKESYLYTPLILLSKKTLN